MLNSIKTYALAGLGIITTIFAALFYREKAKRKDALLKGLEEAREIEHEAQDQLTEDLDREVKARENATNSTKRDGFE